MDSAQIRERYCLDAADVVRELIALSVVEASFTQDVAITVRVHENTAILEDTGRGIRLEPDPGDTISHAERALTTIYPVRPADAATDTALCDLVWGSRGSLGPALANAWCESLEFQSRRDGEEWAQSYRRGVPSGPPRHIGSADRTGTTIRITTASPIDSASIAVFVRELTLRLANVQIRIDA